MAVELTKAQLNAYKDLYITDENVKWLSNPELYTITPTSDGTTGYDTFNGVPEANTTDDGADDGKISFGKKVGNFFKGLVKPVTTMFSSPGNFIKGALGIAACAGLIAITGGAAAPFLVAGGLVMGGVQFAKGAVNAATAKTDAEAEAAWQDIGTGTFTVGASLAGAKAAVKGANTAGVAGFEGAESASTLSAAKMCLKPTNLINAGKTSFTNASTKVGAFLGSKGATSTTESAASSTESGANTEGTKTTNEKIEKMKLDNKKRKINTEKRRAAQYEYNEKAKIKFEEKQKAETELAQQRAKTVTEKMKNGKTASEVKTEATKNLSNENKRIVKNAIKEGTDNQRAIEAENAKVDKFMGQYDRVKGRMSNLNDAELRHTAKTSKNEYTRMAAEDLLKERKVAAPETTTTTEVKTVAEAKPAVAKPQHKATMNDPRVQASAQKMRYFNKEKLQKLIDSPKTSKIDRAAAQAVLAGKI